MTLRFGQVELDEDRYELRRDGTARHLEPKVFDLLLYLVRNRDRLVTKQDLLDNVWPGVVVAESALTRAVSLARAAIGDSARSQAIIETVSGRGYRFRAPVEIDPPTASGTTTVAAGRPRATRRLLIALGLGVTLLVAGWLGRPLWIGLYLDVIGLADPPEHPPLPNLPSVAVLPFVDLGPDRHAALAEGIADELSEELVRIRELFVIARSSAFTYRDRAVDVRRVGRELGVRYVVEGRVRAGDGRVVVSAQLVDAQSGFYRWSGRHEAKPGDDLALQSEIVTAILQNLGASLLDAEIERAGGRTAPPSSAQIAYLQARAAWYEFRRDPNRRAETLLEWARQRAPEDPRVHALLASTHLAAYGFGWDADPRRLERGAAAAQQALDLDPFSGRAHAALAAAHLYAGRRRDAVDAARRAVEVGPNSDLCFAVQAMALAADRQLGAAVRSLNRALRLNPRHPSPYWLLLGYLHQSAGRDERAAGVWERVRVASPDLIPPRLALLRHFDAHGAVDQARALAEEILRINPAFTTDAAVQIDPRRFTMNAAAVESLRAQLRRTGIPQAEPNTDAPGRKRGES